MIFNRIQTVSADRIVASCRSYLLIEATYREATGDASDTRTALEFDVQYYLGNGTLERLGR